MNKVRAGAEARTSKPSRIKGFETAQNKQYGARFGFKEPKVKATNETLDEALNFDASFPDVWAALTHVNSITEQYGITLPDIEELEDDEFGEEVFQVDEDAYLYFCYALNEHNEYDIVSGVFNSSELDELLSEDENISEAIKGGKSLEISGFEKKNKPNYEPGKIKKSSKPILIKKFPPPKKK